MGTEFRLIAALAMLTLSAAAPPTPHFYGLSAGNVGAFTSSPDGSAISVLFDNLRMERSSAGPQPKRAAERHFTLAATPAAAGCRTTLALRGSSSAVGTARASTITLSVAGHVTTLRPEQDDWTFTVPAALARHQRTDVTITLNLPAVEGGGTALLEVDSVDVSLGKCGRRQ